LSRQESSLSCRAIQEGDRELTSTMAQVLDNSRSGSVVKLQVVRFNLPLAEL